MMDTHKCNLWLKTSVNLGTLLRSTNGHNFCNLNLTQIQHTDQNYLRSFADKHTLSIKKILFLYIFVDIRVLLT